MMEIATQSLELVAQQVLDVLIVHGVTCEVDTMVLTNPMTAIQFVVQLTVVAQSAPCMSVSLDSLLAVLLLLLPQYPIYGNTFFQQLIAIIPLCRPTSVGVANFCDILRTSLREKRESLENTDDDITVDSSPSTIFVESPYSFLPDRLQLPLELHESLLVALKKCIINDDPPSIIFGEKENNSWALSAPSIPWTLSSGYVMTSWMKLTPPPVLVEIGDNGPSLGAFDWFSFNFQSANRQYSLVCQLTPILHSDTTSPPPMSRAGLYADSYQTQLFNLQMVIDCGNRRLGEAHEPLKCSTTIQVRVSSWHLWSVTHNSSSESVTIKIDGTVVGTFDLPYPSSDTRELYMNFGRSLRGQVSSISCYGLEIDEQMPLLYSCGPFLENAKSDLSVPQTSTNTGHSSLGSLLTRSSVNSIPCVFCIHAASAAAGQYSRRVGKLLHNETQLVPPTSEDEVSLLMTLNSHVTVSQSQSWVCALQEAGGISLLLYTIWAYSCQFEDCMKNTPPFGDFALASPQQLLLRQCLQCSVSLFASALSRSIQLREQCLQIHGFHILSSFFSVLTTETRRFIVDKPFVEVAFDVQAALGRDGVTGDLCAAVLQGWLCNWSVWTASRPAAISHFLQCLSALCQENTSIRCMFYRSIGVSRLLDVCRLYFASVLDTSSTLSESWHKSEDTTTAACANDATNFAIECADAVLSLLESQRQSVEAQMKSSPSAKVEIAKRFGEDLIAILSTLEETESPLLAERLLKFITTSRTNHPNEVEYAVRRSWSKQLVSVSLLLTRRGLSLACRGKVLDLYCWQLRSLYSRALHSEYLSAIKARTTRLQTGVTFVNPLRDWMEANLMKKLRRRVSILLTQSKTLMQSLESGDWHSSLVSVTSAEFLHISVLSRISPDAITPSMKLSLIAQGSIDELVLDLLADADEAQWLWLPFLPPLLQRTSKPVCESVTKCVALQLENNEEQRLLLATILPTRDWVTLIVQIIITGIWHSVHASVDEYSPEKTQIDLLLDYLNNSQAVLSLGVVADNALDMLTLLIESSARHGLQGRDVLVWLPDVLALECTATVFSVGGESSLGVQLTTFLMRRLLPRIAVRLSTVWAEANMWSETTLSSVDCWLDLVAAWSLPDILEISSSYSTSESQACENILSTTDSTVREGTTTACLNPIQEVTIQGLLAILARLRALPPRLTPSIAPYRIQVSSSQSRQRAFWVPYTRGIAFLCDVVRILPTRLADRAAAELLEFHRRAMERDCLLSPLKLTALAASLLQLATELAIHPTGAVGDDTAQRWVNFGMSMARVIRTRRVKAEQMPEKAALSAAGAALCEEWRLAERNRGDCPTDFENLQALWIALDSQRRQVIHFDDELSPAEIEAATAAIDAATAANVNLLEESQPQGSNVSNSMIEFADYNDKSTEVEDLLAFTASFSSSLSTTAVAAESTEVENGDNAISASGKDKLDDNDKIVEDEEVSDDECYDEDLPGLQETPSPVPSNNSPSDIENESHDTQLVTEEASSVNVDINNAFNNNGISLTLQSPTTILLSLDSVSSVSTRRQRRLSLSASGIPSIGSPPESAATDAMSSTVALLSASSTIAARQENRLRRVIGHAELSLSAVNRIWTRMQRKVESEIFRETHRCHWKLGIAHEAPLSHGRMRLILRPRYDIKFAPPPPEPEEDNRLVSTVRTSIDCMDGSVNDLVGEALASLRTDDLNRALRDVVAAESATDAALDAITDDATKPVSTVCGEWNFPDVSEFDVSQKDAVQPVCPVPNEAPVFDIDRSSQTKSSQAVVSSTTRPSNRSAQALIALEESLRADSITHSVSIETGPLFAPRPSLDGPSSTHNNGPLEARVLLVTASGSVPGVISLTDDDQLFFRSTHDALSSHLTAADSATVHVHSSDHSSSHSSPPLKLRRWHWHLSAARGIYTRRYRQRDSAVELFFFSGKHRSLFLDFGSTKSDVQVRNRFVTSLFSRVPPTCLTKRLEVSAPRLLKEHQHVVQRWVNGGMSNFDYLMALNTLAGRSFHDLTQYPIFPWVISDYSSSFLDLNNPAVYRDLSKPMGAINEKRLAEFLDRFRSLDEQNDLVGSLSGSSRGTSGTIPPFMYGSHYSTMVGVVLHFLVRLQPFASLHREMQNGRFDVADRLFSSIPRAWKHNTTQLSEVKELTPEWFTTPDMFRNLNNFDFGATQDGEAVSDVELPPWASSPEEFVRLNREALESDYVSEHLHLWIDLIFGYKQNGRAAVEAQNVFYHLTYPNAVDLYSIEDEAIRRATEMQIAHFGQTPMQLFRHPHEPKKRLLSNDSLTNSRISGNTAGGIGGSLSGRSLGALGDSSLVSRPLKKIFSEDNISMFVRATNDEEALAIYAPCTLVQRHSPTVVISLIPHSDALLCIADNGTIEALKFSLSEEAKRALASTKLSRSRMNNSETPLGNGSNGPTTAEELLFGSPIDHSVAMTYSETQGSKTSNSCYPPEQNLLNRGESLFYIEKEISHFDIVPRVPLSRYTSKSSSNITRSSSTSLESSSGLFQLGGETLLESLSRRISVTRSRSLVFSFGALDGSVAIRKLDERTGFVLSAADFTAHKKRVVALASDSLAGPAGTPPPGLSGGFAGLTLGLSGSSSSHGSGVVDTVATIDESGVVLIWNISQGDSSASSASVTVSRRPTLRFRVKPAPDMHIAVSAVFRIAVAVSGGSVSIFSLERDELLRTFNLIYSENDIFPGRNSSQNISEEDVKSPPQYADLLPSLVEYCYTGPPSRAFPQRSLVSLVLTQSESVLATRFLTRRVVFSSSHTLLVVYVEVSVYDERAGHHLPHHLLQTYNLSGTRIGSLLCDVPITFLSCPGEGDLIVVGDANGSLAFRRTHNLELLHRLNPSEQAVSLPLHTTKQTTRRGSTGTSSMSNSGMSSSDFGRRASLGGSTMDSSAITSVSFAPCDESPVVIFIATAAGNIYLRSLPDFLRWEPHRNPSALAQANAVVRGTIQQASTWTSETAGLLAQNAKSLATDLRKGFSSFFGPKKT